MAKRDINKYINQFVHGDCEEVLKQLPSGSIDLIVTSPPYADQRDYGNADVYIEDTHTAMEIKTIISSQKNALFPSVKSERSLRQLERIKLLLEEGYNVCYTFVSLSPRVRSIELDRASAFYPAFLACVKKGMSYYGCSLEYRKGEIGIAASIEVIIQALDSFFLKAKVVDDRNVEYNGVIMSLTALAKQLSGKKYAIAGPKFFKYKGEWLNDRRQRLGV